MKAAICTKTGSIDNVEIQEVVKPIPKKNEVLIKVKAASINATDLEVVMGNFFVKLGGPKKPCRFGCDLSGIVENVGNEVKNWSIGDSVMTNLAYQNYGAFAEYVCVSEKILFHKPREISHAQAATMQEAAGLANQGMNYGRTIKKGDRILINGAGGGVGTFGIQIAKYFGAEVTGVDSREKFDMMKSIGADHVIDYLSEDFSKNKIKYDRIIDVISHHSVYAYRRALKKDGQALIIGGTTGKIFQTMIWGTLSSKFRNKNVNILMGKANQKSDLDSNTKLFNEGKLTPVIDKVYPLATIKEALTYHHAGHTKGKLVITM